MCVCVCVFMYCWGGGVWKDGVFVWGVGEGGSTYGVCVWVCVCMCVCVCECVLGGGGGVQVRERGSSECERQPEDSVLFRVNVT